MSGSESNESCYAVQTVNLLKSYEDNKCVLDKLNVHVKQGAIYGLLGSSGCGKTTLISCLLGLRKWEKGEVYLFGNKISNNCDGIGKFSSEVGYMPQDLALQEQLTPVELFRLYGSLYEMTKSEIIEKSEALMKLLNLTSCKNRKVCQLSGGQKRRVSLAVTLLNTPKLLILDEPTVGVDPLLRVSIWGHLMNLCKNFKVTIVISTHYVEELRSANMVGILRNGRLVAEHNPTTLMHIYSTSLLEHAVLKITRQDQAGSLIPSNFSDLENLNNSLNNQLSCVEVDTKHFKQNNINSKHTHLTEKPLWKRFLIWWQQIFLYVFYLELSIFRIPISNLIIALVPLVQLYATMFVIGTDPKGIQLAIINNEVPNWMEECSHINLQSCDVIQISCRFLHELQSLDKLTLVHYNSTTEATRDIKSGRLWGYLEIPNTFTETMVSRVAERQFVNNETLDRALMNLQMDMSEVTVAAYTFLSLRDSYNNLISGLTTLCDFDLSLMEYPVKQGDTPVYGDFEGRYEDDVVTSIIIVIIIEFTIAFVPMTLLHEHEKGSLQRIQTAGLSTSQAMISHSMSIGLITLVQTLICSVFASISSNSNVFAAPLGSYVLTLVITCGCGVAVGTIMAIVFKNANVCIVLVAFFVPLISILMGVIRPRSTIPFVYQTVSYFLPIVAVADSLKSIVNRKVDLTHPSVYPGVGLTFGWFCVLIAICFLSKRRLQT